MPVLRADAALLFNTACWGATFVLVKAALSDVSPIVFLALRFGLAAVALGVIFRGVGRVRWSWSEAGAGALTGAFLYFGFALQTAGLRLTSAPKSAFLTGLTCIMVPLLGALVYKTRPQASEVVGVLVATAGLGLMTLEGVTGWIGRGDALTLLATIAFAAHIIALGHFSGQMSFEILSVTQIAAGAVLALAMFWWAETPRLAWHPAVVWAILVTGVVCTAVAFTIQAWAQQYTTSTRTALIYMLEPVFAWITSFVVAGEGLSGRASLGAAFILGGVLLVELKPLKSRPHP
jgi:drug/metabolite transporter (DMT)-like permease